MHRTLQRAIVKVEKPIPCEECDKPMALVLEIVETTEFVPGKTVLLDEEAWECDACEVEYSFEDDNDLTPEDMATLEAEIERLMEATIHQLEAEADEKRTAERTARLAEQRRLQRAKR